MTLEEAIKYYREKALSCSNEQRECALEHIQLIDWLKELKCLRLVVDKNQQKYSKMQSHGDFK